MTQPGRQRSAAIARWRGRSPGANSTSGWGIGRTTWCARSRRVLVSVWRHRWLAECPRRSRRDRL